MDKENLLEIDDLVVAVDGREILHGLNLAVKPGETNVIFGPNGGGKTTLLMTIMGFPRYKVLRGKIYFKGQDITDNARGRTRAHGHRHLFPAPAGGARRQNARHGDGLPQDGENDALVNELAEKAHLC